MAGLAPPIIAAQTVMANTGNPTPAHLRYAEGLRVSIPASLQTAAHEGLGASTLVYALLLSDDEAVRRKQLDELAARDLRRGLPGNAARAAGRASRRHARQTAAG